MDAMQAGDLDIAYLCTCPVVAYIFKGLDAKIIAGVNTNGSNLVLRPGLDYQGPTYMHGLNIVTYPAGTAQDLLLKKWLLDNGISLSEVNITAKAPGDAVKAMLTGKVDDAFLPQPASAMVELSGKGRSVLASGEIWHNHACCGIIASGKLMREHPDLVEQIVKTQIKATDYVNAHPEEAARVYSNRTGQDFKMVNYSIRTWDGRWISDPQPLVNDTLEFSDLLYNLGYVKGRLNKEELFDLRFYDNVTRLEGGK